MNLDLRGRSALGCVPTSAFEFMSDYLPGQFAEWSQSSESADSLDIPPLAILTEAHSWVLVRAHDSIQLLHADPEGLPSFRWSTSEAEMLDLLNDQITPIGLLANQRMRLSGGTLDQFLNWWLVIRSCLDSVPIHRAGAVDLKLSQPPERTLDEDPDVLSAELADYGFLRLRGVFSSSEMAQIAADMDQAQRSYNKGDGQSWWARTEAGDERVVRMQRFDECSPAAASILRDDRIAVIAALGRSGHRVDPSAINRIEAVVKPLNVVEGISDAPWHKDCYFGRHSHDCCSLTVDISVTSSNVDAGQIRFIAGSHRALVWPSLLDGSTLGLPDVAVPTEVGDVNLHLSCTLHMDEPPTTAERKLLHFNLVLPELEDEQAREADRAARRRLESPAREPGLIHLWGK